MAALVAAFFTAGDNMSDDPYADGYAAGTKAEWSKCVQVCEAWQSQTYIQSHYGNYGDYDLKVILKVVGLIKQDIEKTIL